MLKKVRDDYDAKIFQDELSQKIIVPYTLSRITQLYAVIQWLCAGLKFFGVSCEEINLFLRKKAVLKDVFWFTNFVFTDPKREFSKKDFLRYKKWQKSLL